MGATWTDPSQLCWSRCLPLADGDGPRLRRLRHADLEASRVPERWRTHRPCDQPNRRRDPLDRPDHGPLAAGATEAQWSLWPVFVLAFAAQLAFDAATTWLRIYLGDRGGAVEVVRRSPRDVPRRRACLPRRPAGGSRGRAKSGDHPRCPAAVRVGGGVRPRAGCRIESAFTLSSAYQGMAELLGEVLSTSDEYTGSHSRSVLVLAHQVAERLGLDELENTLGRVWLLASRHRQACDPE